MISGYRGMGTGGNQLVATVGGTVGGVVAAGASSSAILAMLGLGASAGPIGLAIGALVAGVASVLGALGVGEGCGNTCVQATDIVNQAEPILQQNIAGYFSGTIGYQEALSNFQTIWSQIQQACGVIPGDAGKNCIGDRSDGACRWKQTGQPQFPGQPQLGECWNWWKAYYYPILNNPPGSTNGPAGTTSNVSAGNIIGSVESALGSNWVLLAGAGLIGLALISSE